MKDLMRVFFNDPANSIFSILFLVTLALLLFTDVFSFV